MGCQLPDHPTDHCKPSGTLTSWGQKQESIEVKAWRVPETLAQNVNGCELRTLSETGFRGSQLGNNSHFGYKLIDFRMMMDDDG